MKTKWTLFIIIIILLSALGALLVCVGIEGISNAINIIRNPNPSTENATSEWPVVSYGFDQTTNITTISIKSRDKQNLVLFDGRDLLLNIQSLTANLTAAQSRIAELESRPIPTVTVTVTPPPVTVEVPTIPPEGFVMWDDLTSDNLSYTDYQTYMQVSDYIQNFQATTTITSGNCTAWMMALANRARHDGKPIGLALMFKQRADGAITEAHFTNFVIIGKKVLRIEPQTGQISNWDGWRLAIP